MILANGASFGGDVGRISVMGESAGGYLARVMGYQASQTPEAVISLAGYSDILGQWYTEPAYLPPPDYDYGAFDHIEMSYNADVGILGTNQITVALYKSGLPVDSFTRTYQGEFAFGNIDIVQGIGTANTLWVLADIDNLRVVPEPSGVILVALVLGVLMACATRSVSPTLARTADISTFY